MTVPKGVQAFREHYQRTEVSRFYHPVFHVFFEFGLGLVALCFALYQVEDFKLRHIALFLGMLLIANVIEYIAHRFVLHRKIRFLRFAYREHTELHHSYFTHDAYEITAPIDIHRVLFPPIGILIFMGLLAAPLSLLTALLLSPTDGWIVFATSVFYFLLYELFHLGSHFSFSKRIPGFRFIREHHRMHHDPRKMQTTAFNVTFPLVDTLLAWIESVSKKTPSH